MTGFRNLMTGAAGVSTGGYAVDNSVLFYNSGDYPNLSRTFSSPTNGAKWTMSLWVKRNDLSRDQHFFGTNANNWFNFSFNASDQLNISYDDGTGSNYAQLRTTQVFRDPHAWTHIVVQNDTALATSTDRHKLFINGSRVTDFSTTNFQSQSSTSKLNSAIQHMFAYYNQLLAKAAHLYIAEFAFNDGQAYTASDYGEYSTAGVWRPKDLSGLDFTGNNSSYLEFKDSSSLGTATSGQNWSPYLLDQTNDSPTKNFATLSSITELQGGAVTLSEGNLSGLGTTTTVWNRNRASIQLSAAAGGKYIWAIKPDAIGGGRGDPWITNELYDDGNNNNNSVQLNSNAWIMSLDGTTLFMEYDQGVRTDHTMSPAAATGDFMLCAIDLDNMKVWWGYYDVSTTTLYWADNSTGFSGDPTDGGTTACATLVGNHFKIGVGLYSGRSCEVDFGQGVHDLLSSITIPTGYKFITAANLFEASAPTIEDPDDHFKEVIVNKASSATFTIPWNTYNGTSGTYDTLFSIKRVGAGEKWFVVDTVRGLDKYFSWDATTAQSTDSNVISVSGTTGTLGSTLAADSYLVQMYKLGAQASRDTSNSEGSITGTGNSLIISANTTAGWSVCTYVGTGANGTFGHGLDSAPEFVRWYNTVSADAITVYHAFGPSTPATHYGNFDDAAVHLKNNDTTKFNSTAPNTTVNSVGSADSTNGSTDAMWCFSTHSIAGFNRIGSFIGNGAADGTVVMSDLRAKSVMIKNADDNSSSDRWHLISDARFLYNGDAAVVFFDGTDIENATNLVDFLSNGFKVRVTDPAVNESTDTMVYQIIGSPFAATTPATAR